MKTPELYFVDGSLPETPAPDQHPEPWRTTRVVGKPLARVDGYERLSGAAVYPSDVVLPDMLYGAILRCPHANATVTKVDAGAAAKMPGVRAVITGATPAADLRWYYSRTVFTKLFDPHCRFAGEAVAAVAAETPQQAWDAVRAIAVEYDVLPFVVDEHKALEPGAVAVQTGGNRVGEPEVYARGDVGRGFAEADTVLEATYTTAAEVHTPMELHGCVASWDGPRLTIWESTQGVYPVQQRVAMLLEMPLANVRVIGRYMGGGFGSKLQADKYDLVAAVLAKLAARPVKLFLTREETFVCVGNRPPSTMRLKAGVKKDGTLTALEMSVLGTGGAYPAGGTSLVDWLVRDLYLCPNVRTEMTDVFINGGPSRAFRAPGHPQGAWALEQMMDALAAAIGMDPVELRLKNVPKVSQTRGGQPYTTTGPGPLPGGGRRRVRLAGGAPALEGRRGRSGAASGWRRACGSRAAAARRPPIVVKLFADGSANLNMGASDLGTGTKTVMAMVVSEELGVPLEKIQIENADTGTTQYATASGGSKTVPTEAPAVRDAALAVKRQLFEIAGAELKVGAGELRIEGDEVVSASDPKVRRKIAELEGVQRRGLLDRRRDAGPQPRGQGRQPVRRAVLRGRGGHPHGRGPGDQVPVGQRQRPGHEPAHVRQPGDRRDHDGDRLRPDGAARVRPPDRHDAERQLARLQDPDRHGRPGGHRRRSRSRSPTTRPTRPAPRGSASRSRSRRPRRSPTPSTTPPACASPTRRSARCAWSPLLAAHGRGGER